MFTVINFDDDDQLVMVENKPKERKTFFFQVKHKPKKEEYRNIKKKFMKKNSPRARQEILN